MVIILNSVRFDGTLWDASFTCQAASFETVLVIKMRCTNFIVIYSDLVDIFYKVWL